MTIGKILFSLLLIVSTSKFNAQTNSYKFYKAKKETDKHSWILLLPGSSGLTIFDDSTFYDRKAEYLTSLGYDILLFDYKSFYKTSTAPDKPKGTTGEKISWVVKQVIQFATAKQQIDTSNNGHIIGWSLSGEGVFRLLKDTGFIAENKISSVALFYPSNIENLQITTTIPLLIQIGESDKTVVADKIKKEIKSLDRVKFKTYPNSFHGFDIETITKPITIKLPPIIGKKHTFLYNKEATEKAYVELVNFLNE